MTGRYKRTARSHHIDRGRSDGARSVLSDSLPFRHVAIAALKGYRARAGRRLAGAGFHDLKLEAAGLTDKNVAFLHLRAIRHGSLLFQRFVLV